MSSTEAEIAARIFLPFVVPICLWVAWSDMARMKIPNRAVIALGLVFLFVGPVALPLDVWAWRWVHLVAILAGGFVLSAIGAVGAGDAKFAAVAAPFVAVPQAGEMLFLLAAVMLAAFATHRLARAMPAIRARVPDWESWSSPKFPMGLALAPALVFHLALSAI